jgi:hypothetical protein
MSAHEKKGMPEGTEVLILAAAMFVGIILLMILMRALAP